MATSGSIVFAMTAEEVVAQSLQRIGVLGEGETASAMQYGTGQRELNLLLKTFPFAGAGLMRRAEQTVSLTSSATTPTGIYALSPRPYSVINARFAVDGVEQRPLHEWDREDFDAAPIKSTTGTPIAYIVDRQRETTSLRFWPIPNEPATQTWTVVVSYERVPESVTAASQEVDVPQEQHDALIDALGAAQVPIYGLAGDPNAQLVLARAAKLDLALASDRRGSLTFGAV